MSTVGEEREAGVPRDTWRHVCANLGEDMWDHERVLVQGQLISGKHNGRSQWALAACQMLPIYLTVFRVILLRASQ